MRRSKRASRTAARRAAASVADAAPAGPASPPGIGTPDAGAAVLTASPLHSPLDAKVLVLNKLYMAVRVISARRAFAMLFRDLAEVIHVENGQYLSYDFNSWAEVSALQRELEPEDHDFVSTVRFHIAVPRVIRLLAYDRLPRQGVKLNRRNLFARDRNQCQYCGHHFPTTELSIDHVVPKSQGGEDSWTNLVCACVSCNSRKGGRTPTQAGIKLVRAAKEPRANPLITVKLGTGRYESWKAFLDNAYWSVELR